MATSFGYWAGSGINILQMEQNSACRLLRNNTQVYIDLPVE
jgi:hypothetical protein